MNQWMGAADRSGEFERGEHLTVHHRLQIVLSIYLLTYLLTYLLEFPNVTMALANSTERIKDRFMDVTEEWS